MKNTIRIAQQQILQAYIHCYRPLSL